MRIKIGDKVTAPGLEELGEGEVFYTEDYPEAGNGESRQFIRVEFPGGRILLTNPSFVRRVRKPERPPHP